MEYVRFKINILQILVVAKRLYLKKIKEALYIDIKRKYKEEMEGVHDSVFNNQNKQLMAKVNFLYQAESFMSESHISQLHDNAQKTTRKWRYFIQGVMKRKVQGKIRTRLKQGLLKESRKLIV